VRNRFLRVTAVLVALAFSAGAVRADLVSWSYTSGGGSLSNGTDSIAPPYDGWREIDYNGMGPTIEKGSQQISLISSVVVNIIRPGNGDFYPIGGEFVSGLTITDLASKKSGWIDPGIEFFASEQSAYLNPNDTAPRILTLGANRYTITPLGGYDVSVDVSPIVANSPEPSSILLAAFSTFALLGYLRRRVARVSV